MGQFCYVCLQFKARCCRLDFFSTFKFDTKKPVQPRSPPFINHKISIVPPLNMSDAQVAPITENGAPPVTQDKVEETPGFKVTSTSILRHARQYLTAIQVFAGNLAYSTTDEGLKAFFAPVQSDMYVPLFFLLSLAQHCHFSNSTLVFPLKSF